MTPGQQKVRAAINRALKHLEQRRKDDQSSIVELSACIREIDEGREMEVRIPAPENDEPTNPGVPKPHSRPMPAVTEKGRNR